MPEATGPGIQQPDASVGTAHRQQMPPLREDELADHPGRAQTEVARRGGWSPGVDSPYAEPSERHRGNPGRRLSLVVVRRGDELAVGRKRGRFDYIGETDERPQTRQGSL